MEPPKYKKTPGYATTDGQELEWTLSALLFLRGLNSGHDFEIASNVAGAGVFDDIVFRFKPSEGGDAWTTLYVQLKFKANKPIDRTELTNNKGQFYVPKYFKSYLEIKQAMSNPEKGSLFDGSFEKSEFMIYTNAKASEGLGMECSRPLSKPEVIICGNVGKVFSFEEEEDILKCLDDCGDEGKDFLGRFRVFSNQPTATELQDAIKSELRNLGKSVIKKVDYQSLFYCFLQRVKIWWNKSSEVLHKGNDLFRSSVLEITSQQTKADYNSEVLDFEEVCLSKLRDSVVGDSKVVIVQSSERSCRLSFTKLCQAFGGQALPLDCGGLLANKVALLAQWQKGNDKILIICTNDWNKERQVDYFSVINGLLAIRDTHPIVFLSNNKSCAVEAIAGKFPGVKSCVDDFLFSQLTEKSRDSVLAKEVSLQGQSTSLFELLNGHRKEVDLVLDAGSVMEVLECVDIVTLGTAFDKGIDFYVDRHLEQATVVTASVFQDGTFQGNVTVRVMQCETKENLSFERDIIAIPRISETNNRGRLFQMAVSFLSSQNDATSLHDVNLGKIVSNLSHSVLVADEDNSEVFIGPRFSFGLFECNSVGLRFGQQDAVFALLVHTKKHSSEGGFLFVSDKTSENDVKKLSDFHQSKHLLSLENGQLRWIQSHGDIESIRPHIDEGQVTKFTPKNAMDIEDRLVLVCAEPGMGKSTLMARLAKNTKEAHPHHFVFLIALNDHSQLFAQNTHKDVLDFLCRANKIDSHLHRTLLKFALEVSGNIVLLFDGFDEIAPKYVRQSCALLKSLIEKSKASKIWMTSRNSIRSTLEASVLKLSVRLQKFIEEDQKKFLKGFWKSKSELSEIELDSFSKQLIAKTSQAVRDKEKDFMGIPLQTQMLAEVYEDHVTGSTEKTKLPDHLDLLVLLEQFVDKKCDIYVQDKVKISPANPLYEEMLENVRKNFNKDHRKAALILILDDEEEQNLHMKSIIKDSSEFFKKIESGTYKTGFIDSIVNGKPRFIHRVFAEYFVAKWISEHFADNREFIESKMFTADFAVVRNIFDRILAKDCSLHTAVLNDDLEGVRTLLQDADVDAKDGGGRTALHLGASRGTSEDQEENKRRGEILDLLIAHTSNFDQVDDVFGGTPLKYADLTRSWIAVDRFKPCQENKEQFTLILKDVTHHVMLDTVCKFDLHHLLDFCLDNGLQVEHGLDGGSRLLSRACELGSLKVASLLIERNADIEARDDIGQLPLHKASATGHTEVVERILLNVNTLATASNHELTLPQPLKPADYINMGDLNGRTAIFYAAQNGHFNIIRMIIGKGGDPQYRNQDNCSPLHIAAGFKHPNAVSVLLEALDEADRAAAVNSKDNDGASVLMYGALGGCVECVGLIVKAGGKMTLRNYIGRTPLMLAAFEGHQEVVSYLLNNFNAECEGMNLHDYINMRDTNGRTAIHNGASKGHPEVISFLIGKGGDPQCRDADSSTPLHIAAEFKHHNAVSVLLEALDEADRAAVVNLSGKDRNSVLINGALSGCVECVELIVKAGGKMTNINDTGQTPLMLATLQGHQEVVNYMLTNFNGEYQGMNLHDYINMRDNDGWTAIHDGARNDHSEVISFLIDHGADPQCRDNDNSTPLHIAASFKHLNAVSVLLEALDEADRAAAVNSKDNDGNSVLMRGALGGCVECVGLIVKAGGKMTLSNDIGETPLMLAALEGHQQVVIYLLNNFNAESERMNLHDYINMGDTDGWTAIHDAARNGHSEVISFLIDQGANPQCRDYDNFTPLHFAAEFKHPNAVSVLLETLDEADRAAVVNLKDNDGDSVFIRGALGGCVECVGLIVEAGGKMTLRDGNGRTSLMAAAFEGHQKVVSYLLDNFNAKIEGMNLHDYINMGDTDGRTAIYFAARKGHSEVISFLIDQGGDPQSRDHDNSTSLHWAAEFKHPKAVSVLLEALDEADRAAAVNSKDNDGDSVLMCGALGGCVECVGLIVKAGGKMTLRDGNGRTPLMLAALQGHQEVVSYLLKNFYRKSEMMNLHDYINMRDNDGRTAIRHAARNDHSEVISFLFDYGGDLQCSDNVNISPLHIAAGFKHPNAVSVLLEALDEADRAAAVNLKDNDGNSVLMRGALGGCVECVGLIVKAGGKMTLRNDNGHTPLMAAAIKGHQKVVSYLLDNFNVESEGMYLHDYINMGDTNGLTAMHNAAGNGHSEVISFLIDYGGKPQCRDNHNCTPLHNAAEFKHPNVVSVLLEALDEADRAAAVNLKDNDGDSVLMCGALGGCVECVGLIVKAGGKMTLSNDNGQTPLMIAALEGHQEVLSYMLNNFNAESEGMNLHDYINMGDNDGWTAIRHAARNGHSEAISIIIGHGGDPQCRDRHNVTPLHIAAGFKHPNAVSVLLEALDEADRAAVVNSKDNDGNSVLMRGALGGCVVCVGLIIKAGGKMTLRNNIGRTPLMAAARKRFSPVVAHLLSVFEQERECCTKLAYINMVDKSGNTALDLTSLECREILQGFLIDLLVD